MRRLGILMMVIPTGCAVLAEIAQGIMTGFMNVPADGWSDLNFDNEASVIGSVMFIACTFLCGYGAELLEEKQCRKIAADVALHMENDQTAIGAFDGEEVIGFITVSQHTLQGKVRQHIKRLAVYMPRKSTGNWRKKNHAMCSLNMFLYKKMELLEVV